MKRITFVSLFFAGLAVAAVAIGQPGGPAKPITATTARVWRPLADHPTGGHFVFFMDREKMRGKNAGQSKPFKLDPSNSAHFAKAITLPIDWARSLNFPMYLNDQYGDCYYAAGCHADNTWTGNATVKSEFSLAAIKSRYFSLSGGDNGLNDSDMQGEMTGRYLADVPDAKIISWLEIDSTDPATVQDCLQNFGVVIFTLAVPNPWINNSNTGAIWDVPAVPNRNNGHAVIFNGCDTRGYYKLQTWGSFVWITPAGVRACDPGAWVAFSARWFSPQTGRAANGVHIVDLAKLWQARGGKAIPASVIASFPPPGVDPDPPSPVPPVPPGSLPSITLSGNLPAGTYQLLPKGSIVVSPDTTIKTLVDMLKTSPPSANPASSPRGEGIRRDRNDLNTDPVFADLLQEYLGFREKSVLRFEAQEKSIRNLLGVVESMQKMLGGSSPQTLLLKPGPK